MAVITGIVVFLMITTVIFWISSLILDENRSENRGEKSQKRTKNATGTSSIVTYLEIKPLFFNGYTFFTGEL